MTALILDTSSSPGSGGRPIRFLHRSCYLCRGLHREPSFGGDGGSRSLLDERDNVSRADLILGNLLALASRHLPGSPTAELPGLAPPVSQPRANGAGPAAWPAAG